MNTSTELFVLALGVLDHEPSTHKVLADVLEEQGELGMAQWARSKKSSRPKRLDFVMAVLPYKMGLVVACDFAERALDLRPAPASQSRRAQREYIDVVPETSELIQIVKSVRSALADTVNKEAMIALQCELLRVANTGRYGREIGEMLFALHSATVSVLNADECRFGNDYKGERAKVTECRSGVRKIAKLARQVALQFALQAIREGAHRRVRDAEARLNVTEYANWQFAHLRNFLTELIEKPSE